MESATVEEDVLVPAFAENETLCQLLFSHMEYRFHVSLPVPENCAPWLQGWLPVAVYPRRCMLSLAGRSTSFKDRSLH
jgi:hypothetical protein